MELLCPRHAAAQPSHFTMGDCNHTAHEQVLTAEDDITVVFHKVDSHGITSGGDHDECGDHDERTAERIHLQSNCRLSCDYKDDGDAQETDKDRGRKHSREDGERIRLCPPAFCVRSEPASVEESAREGRRAYAQFPRRLNFSQICIRLNKGC